MVLWVVVYYGSSEAEKRCVVNKKMLAIQKYFCQYRSVNLKSEIPEGTSGEWRVERFTIPKHSIEAVRCALVGRYVIPGAYTRLMRHGNVIMSDTHSEQRDLMPLFWAVKRLNANTALVNGLGLGIAVVGLLQCPSIAHIDVVEKDEHVIHLVAPFLPQKEKITVHHADAYEKEWNGNKWDVVWHDIWDNVPNSDDRSDITKLKRKFGRKCKWQQAWCEHYARRN